MMFNCTETGVKRRLCLGVIILLISMPPWVSSRPVDAQDDEPKLTNFDFAYRKITENSSSEIPEQNFQFQKLAREDEQPRVIGGIDLVRTTGPDEEGLQNPLLSNGSMIVHVIVTSSSSSTSSTSAEDNDETETDSVVEQRQSKGAVVLSEDEPQDLEKTPPLPFESAKFNLEQSARPNPEQEEAVDLKRLPKSSQNDSSRFPPDIFSAFYRAFAQNPDTTTENGHDFFSLPSFYSTEKPPITFSVKPQLRSRPQHNLFLYQQRRRRLFRNRQLEERKSFSLPPAIGDRMMADVPPSSPPLKESGALQDTAEKLEELVKKLDQIEAERISPSPSSLKETTVRPSTKFLLSPSKIAVSVAVTHSESVAPTILPSKPTSDVPSKASSFSPSSVSLSYQRRTFKPKTRTLEPERANRKRNESWATENFDLRDQANIIPGFSGDVAPNPQFKIDEPPSRRKTTRTVSGEIGDHSQQFFNINLKAPSGQKSHSANPTSTSTTTAPPKFPSWQEPAKVWGEPARVWGEPEKVWGEPAKVWSQPAQASWKPNNGNESNKMRELVPSGDDELLLMQSDQPPEDREKNTEDSEVPQGTFVILGDDENEGDSIDGDLGRPLMLHHFTIPPTSSPEPPSPPPPSSNSNSKTVSVSTSVSSSVSSSNRNFAHFARRPPPEGPNDSLVSSSSNTSSNYDSPSGDASSAHKKSGKKFGYVIEGANVRKYRVEERTPDGYIVGEYGVLNNQNAFLRGVRYTADGTINPRLIHEALMKFLSLRR